MKTFTKTITQIVLKIANKVVGNGKCRTFAIKIGVSVP